MPIQKGLLKSLNRINISASAIRHNYLYLSSITPKAAICPVLKGNAYGHGITTTFKLFDSLNAPFLFVDNIFEAFELKGQRVKTPIVIMGYNHPDNYKIKQDFSYCIYDLETAKTLGKYQPGCAVHIFVDTGMHREGIPISELPTFTDKIKKIKGLKIEGLMSHLATADIALENDIYNSQIENYKKALAILQSKGINPKWRHIGASSGRFRITDETFNLFRTGKSLYGISPLSPAINKKLKPALEFTATIIITKQISKGATVGYGATFSAQKDMKIAVISAGYFDGLDRRLSNKGFVSIGKVLCPIIGRASMNMTTIDISAIPKAKTGDIVVVYSNQANMKNSISNSAKIADTIPYDLLSHLSTSVERKVVK